MKVPVKAILALLTAAALGQPAVAKNEAEVPLTARGTELLEKYTSELESLRKEVIAALPALNEAKKTRFLEARSRWNDLKNPNDDDTPADRKALDELREQIQAEVMDAGAVLLPISPRCSRPRTSTRN